MCRYGVFKVHVGRQPTQHQKAALLERSLKTQQRGNVEVDIVLGRPGCSDEKGPKPD